MAALFSAVTSGFHKRIISSLYSLIILILSTALVSPTSLINSSCDPTLQFEDVMTNGHINFYNAFLQQELLFNLHSNSLKNLSTKAVQLHQSRETCLFQAENSLNKLDVALGYDCLVQLHPKDGSEVELYKAIKFGSHGLDIFYTKKAAFNLMKLIVSGHENVVGPFESNKILLARCCTGYRKDDEFFLDSLLKRNISTLNARILYRKSLIATFGRSSSKEDSKRVDLKLAIDTVNKVRQLSQIKQNNMVDIVLILNEKFALPAATTIVSALMNSDLDSFYKFHVVMNPDDEISEPIQKKLASFTHIRNYSIDFINFQNKLISKSMKERMKLRDQLPLMVIYRLFLEKMFPSLDSVLYLDTDVIILRDLNALKRVNMDNHMWGAVMNSVYFPTHSGCNSILPHFYINAGVLIANLKKMRELDAQRMMLENLSSFENCCYFYNDQDVINTIFANHINFLPYRWNSCLNADNSKPRFSNFIVHYPGYPKPWHPEFEALYRNDTSSIPSYTRHYWQYRDVVDRYF